jgi:site-specific DNA recombinase
MSTKTKHLVPAAHIDAGLQSPSVTSGPGLRIVIYLRQSDREQKLSIGQQRKECRDYAQSRGWIVVHEYVDDGKSGSKEIEKRTAFARLLDDAEAKDRTWSAIVTWDTSRFGRLDSQAGAPHKLRLRRAGVWLETAKGERIDWSTSMGRLMDALRSEADNQYSLDISRNAIRGRRAVLDLGYSASPVPYGFDRAYYEGEKLQHVVARRTLFSKPRNWHVKPQPNPAEADVVRWVFEQWATRDMTMLGTVRELAARGVPSPAGQPTWTLAQVKRLLTDRTYCGDLHIGKGCRTKEAHYRIGEQVNADAIPALVERATWDLVRAKVRQREGAEWRPKTASGALSSILKCGHCGYTLARRTYTSGGQVYRYYVCDSATKRPHTGCRQWRASEDELLPVITRELVEAVDFEMLSRLGAMPEQRDPGMLDGLKEQERTLAGQLARASKNILLVDPLNFDAAQKAMTELRHEHERVANAIKLAEAEVTPGRREQWMAWWESVKGTLVEVAPAADVSTPPGELAKHLLLAGPDVDVTLTVESADRVTYHRPALLAAPDALRDLLRRLKVEVHLHWEVRNPGASQPRYRLTTGVLRAQWRPGGDAAAAALDLNGDESGGPSRRRRRAAARPARCR